MCKKIVLGLGCKNKERKRKENPYRHMDIKNLKKKIRESKVSRLLPNICDFQKVNHAQGYRFKNLYNP
jgi:hypothetical protein